MRIALVSERFEPSGGGIENVVWNIASGLAEAGDEVHLIARRGVEARGVNLHRVRAPAFWQPARVSAFSRQVGRKKPRKRFDVVHAFSRTLHQHVFHAGCGSHADYMQNAYGAMGAWARRASPRHAVLLGIERRIFADPSQTIQCASNMVRNEIQRRFGVSESRFSVVHYGVDGQRFDPDRNAAERAPLRRALRADDANVWLLAGSGWRRKGLDTAMRALATAEDRKAMLWVAGNDAIAPWQRLAARIGVAERVRFVGARNDIERFYAAADGLLLPTRYDAFGLVCLEAAAAGIPVVTSRAAGAAELLEKAGAIVDDPEDAAGFAAELDRLSDPTLRARLGANGRSLALRHSWDLHVEHLRALYQRVRP